MYNYLMQHTTDTPATTALKNAEISRRILRAVAESGSLRLGYDAVMGTGAYSKMAFELYDLLRAKIQTTEAVEAVQS